MLNPLETASIIGRLVLWAHIAKSQKQIASGVQVIARCCIFQGNSGSHGTHFHALIKIKTTEQKAHCVWIATFPVGGPPYVPKE